MKAKKLASVCAIALCSAVALAGCNSAASNGNSAFTNPGDYLGGGGEVTTTPTETSSDNVSYAVATVEGTSAVQEEIPEDATRITGETVITEAGNYYINSEISGKITVECEGVVLYLYNASLTYSKKVIESTCSLTITLLGDNTVSNTNTSGSNAIDCTGTLVINGSGTLTVTATKNAIKATSVSIIDATLNIVSDKDGIHAEVDDYDDAEEEPVPDYSDGGYVYLCGATVNIESADDGIQADTFVYIVDSTVNILAGGGAPETVTETSSDNASGKGIKAGAIDWGADETDLDWDGYLVYIVSGDITIDSNDDALHSDSELVITGGTLNLTSGDDAIHSDDLLQISGGEISIDKCYEGIESAKVEISGGVIEICSYEDGINAADGTQTTVGTANSNCHIIISGGYISVNCIGSEGDGIDSNGTILITGGEVYVAGSGNSSDAALDADGGILINGGYVFAVGALGMVETPASNSEQYCVSFATSQSIPAGTTLYVCDSDGNIIMYFVTPRSCQSVIISCPEFESGQTYSIYGGDSLLTTFTVTSTITSVGSGSSISNPGGSPGGNLPGSNVPGFGRR